MFTWSFGWTSSPASARDHLVRVHVRARARAGLEDVDRELVVELAGGDPVAGGGDALGHVRVEQPEVGVHARGGGLDPAEPARDGGGNRLAGDGEVARSPSRSRRPTEVPAGSRLVHAPSLERRARRSSWFPRTGAVTGSAAWTRRSCPTCGSRAGTYLNTASYGLPPSPAWDALQERARATGDGGRTSWEHWGIPGEEARASFARLVGVPVETVAIGAERLDA